MKNQFESNSATQGQRPFRGSLRSAWQAVLRFMVLRPQASANAPQMQYASKAGFYSYLPTTEEQRDWLEQIYRTK